MNFFSQSFYEVYQSPDTVLIAFLLLTFILVFSILDKTRILGGNRGVIVVISFVVALMGSAYLPELRYWINTFNFLLYIVVGVIVFFIARAFVRFAKKQF